MTLGGKPQQTPPMSQVAKPDKPTGQNQSTLQAAATPLTLQAAATPLRGVLAEALPEVRVSANRPRPTSPKSFDFRAGVSSQNKSNSLSNIATTLSDLRSLGLGSSLSLGLSAQPCGSAVDCGLPLACARSLGTAVHTPTIYNSDIDIESAFKTLTKLTFLKSSPESTGQSAYLSPVPSSTTQPSSSPGCNSPQSLILHSYNTTHYHLLYCGFINIRGALIFVDFMGCADPRN